MRALDPDPARRLFAVAARPADLARLPVPRIDRIIADTTFHEIKAGQIRAIAIRTA